MKPLLVLGGTLLTLATLLVSPGAHADDDFTLGRTILLEHGNRGADIPVPLCRYTDAVQLKAKRPLRLERIKLTFNNGQIRTLEIHRNLDKGDKTRWLELGKRRCVTHVKVFGNAHDDTAGVTLRGRDH